MTDEKNLGTRNYRSRRLKLLGAAAPPYSVERSAFLTAALKAEKGDNYHREAQQGLALRAKSRLNATISGNLLLWRQRADYFDYIMPNSKVTAAIEG